MNRLEESLLYFDYLALHALCLWAHPDYSLETVTNFLRILRTKRQNVAFGLTRLAIALARVVLLRVLYLAGRMMHPTPSGGRDYVEHIPDIEAAARALQYCLRTRGKSLKSVLPAGSPVDPSPAKPRFHPIGDPLLGQMQDATPRKRLWGGFFLDKLLNKKGSWTSAGPQ